MLRVEIVVQRIQNDSTLGHLQSGGGERDGVCAKVRVRIVQELVLTREGFNARLEIENGETSALENINVEIEIRETYGSAEFVNDRFSIGEILKRNCCRHFLYDSLTSSVSRIT